MDLKKLTVWLSTGEGLGKSLLGVLAVVGSLWALFDNALGTLFQGFPRWVPAAAAGAVCCAFVVLMVHGFRRFELASRIKDPDRFQLRPDSPEALIGRTAHLQSLVKAVKEHRIVLLDGDSGCGKSALVSAGLLHSFAATDGLRPVVIRDWGDDWVAGPVRAMLSGLYSAAVPADRDKLAWAAPPDLAAASATLFSELQMCLEQWAASGLPRILLVADQFDDYQAQHRDRFIVEGSWLSPGRLEASNEFWRLMALRVAQGQLHLLVVTRSDTAAGLSCVRFLPGEDIVAQTLPRVETEYLHQLLCSVTPDGAQPAVVSQPEEGWHQLRDRIENELKAQGTILMQQVQTLLLGLQQLSALTLREYRAAGGLNDVEAMVISKVVDKAAAAAGGGEFWKRSVRALLGSLVQPGAKGFPPKAKWASMEELGAKIDDPGKLEKILTVLQAENIVRPAEAVAAAASWQLSHDYLARAVLADAHRAQRWNHVLNEGKLQYEQAAHGWRQRWETLLPMGSIVAIAWECLRRRLSLGNARKYYFFCLAKPATLLVGAAVLGMAALVWREQRAVYAEADRIVGQFGTSTEADAVLQVWRAPEKLRTTVFELVSGDKGRLERAALSPWPLAHAGVETLAVHDAVWAMEQYLAKDAGEVNADHYNNMGVAIALMQRSKDVADQKVVTGTLRKWLASVFNYSSYIAIDNVRFEGKDYLLMLKQLEGMPAWTEETRALREGMLSGRGDINLYVAALAQTKDLSAVQAELGFLRAALMVEKSRKKFVMLADIYAEVVFRKDFFNEVGDVLHFLLNKKHKYKDSSLSTEEFAVALAKLAREPRDVEEVMQYLRQNLGVVPDFGLLAPYTSLAMRAWSAAELAKLEFELRAIVNKKNDGVALNNLWESYTNLLLRLGDKSLIMNAVMNLRVILSTYPDAQNRLPSARISDELLEENYIRLVRALSDESSVRSELEHVRGRIVSRRGAASFERQWYKIYDSMVSMLSDASAVALEAKAWWSLMVKSRNDDADNGLNPVPFFLSCVHRLVMLGEVESEFVRSLKQMVESDPVYSVSTVQAMDYAQVALNIGGLLEKRKAAELLWQRIMAARKYNDGYHVESLSRIDGVFELPFGTVASGLDDLDAVKAAAHDLKALLLREKNWRAVKYLSQAYGVLATRLLKSEDTAQQAFWIKNVITLSGHPFLARADDLLKALEEVAGRSFGRDVGTATQWAMKTYGFTAGDLRPSGANEAPDCFISRSRTPTCMGTGAVH